MLLAIDQRERPVYLYDELQQARDLLFEHYLPHYFQQDPVVSGDSARHRTGFISCQSTGQ